MVCQRKQNKSVSTKKWGSFKMIILCVIYNFIFINYCFN